jgi:hypothetical protein
MVVTTNSNCLYVNHRSVLGYATAVSGPFPFSQLRARISLLRTLARTASGKSTT